MDKQINVGCNSVIIQNDQILLGLRKNHFGEGTWGLPGGHLEFGETIEEAVKRELKEELGIDATDLEFMSIVDQAHQAPDRHYIQVNFIINDFKGEITLNEPEYCEEWKFFDLNELPDIFPPHQKIIDSYVNRAVYLH